MAHGGEAAQCAQEAIEQIKEKRYADPYRTGACEIHLIGAVFDAATRNLAAIKVETE